MIAQLERLSWGIPWGEIRIYLKQQYLLIITYTYLQTSTQCLVVEVNLPMGLNIGVARIGTDLAALLLLEYGHVLATDYVNCS